MKTTADLYQATQTIFRAFNYLAPRMEGGEVFPSRPMNPEALAGCILHGCMARLVREIQDRRQQMGPLVQLPSGVGHSSTRKS
ncbi:MAG: hypothetical protein WA655_16180 [Candidatus Korobacteraceae bacterium]